MPIIKVIYRHDDDPWEAIRDQHKYQDDAARDDVVNYCMQSNKAPSSYMGSCGVSLSQPAYEMQRIAEAYGKDCGLRLRHTVLSFSGEEKRKLGRFKKGVLGQLYRIGLYALQYYKDKYQMLFVIHEDTVHYHIHFVMNTVSYVDGAKYRGDKSDYYGFLSYLGTFLKSYYGMNLIPVSD